MLLIRYLGIATDRLVYHAGGTQGLIVAKEVWDVEATQCTCPRRFPVCELRVCVCVCVCLCVCVCGVCVCVCAWLY
jgi:hypothetical protein